MGGGTGTGYLENELEKRLENKFTSNVEATLYNVFSKLCKVLGYDPKQYTEPGKNDPSIVEWTFIDAGNYILSRKVEHFSSQLVCNIHLIKEGKIITHEEIKRKLFGLDPGLLWPYVSRKHLVELVRNYHSKRISKIKISKIVDELKNFINQ